MKVKELCAAPWNAWTARWRAARIHSSMTLGRAHCGRTWCYQATEIKQYFTQRWLAYIVLSGYSSAIVPSVRFSITFWVICFSFIVRIAQPWPCELFVITLHPWIGVTSASVCYGEAWMQKAADFQSLTKLPDEHDDAHHQRLRDTTSIYSI